MSAHAALAGGALDVDVLVHTLDVADGGIDAGGDCFDVHGDGVKTTIQCRKTLTCPILVVPKEIRVQIQYRVIPHGITVSIPQTKRKALL